MRHVAARDHLRGFSLVEVVLVLAIMGTLAALFVPILGSSVPVSAAIASQSAVSSTLDVVADAYDTYGAQPGPDCPAGVPDAGEGQVTNKPAFANPCALDQSSNVRVVGANTASLDASTASVAARTTPTGWVTGVSVAQSTSPNAPVTTCHSAVRFAPGGAETFLQHPATDRGCSGAEALAWSASTQMDTCEPGKGLSWRKVCVLS